MQSFHQSYDTACKGLLHACATHFNWNERSSYFSVANTYSASPASDMPNKHQKCHQYLQYELDTDKGTAKTENEICMLLSGSPSRIYGKRMSCITQNNPNGIKFHSKHGTEPDKAKHCVTKQDDGVCMLNLCMSNSWQYIPFLNSFFYLQSRL